MGVGLGLCTGNKTNANAKYLLVREGAENDLLVRQCTFVHAAAYFHTRDATQWCQFRELHLHLFNFLYRIRDLRPRWSTRRRAGFSCATLYIMYMMVAAMTVYATK